MSVVAWDGRILAADRMSVCAGLKVKAKKVFCSKDGFLFAVTGDLQHVQPLIEWYQIGDKSKYPAFQSTPDWSRLIVVTPKGKCMTFEQLPYPIPVSSRYAAWGTGRDYALGALEMGASAYRAVAVANKFSDSCGFGVEFYGWRTDHAK